MATKGPNEPLDIRDRGLTDVLGDADALSLWELLRRARTPSAASVLAEATGLRLEFVHDCLDRLVEAGLVERVKATSRQRTPRWKALREVIVVGYRVGDPIDEVLIGCVNDLFGPERRQLIRRHVLAADSQAATGPTARDRWSRTWAGRFPRAERRRFWELVPELSRLYHASASRFLGMPPSREQMSTHVVEIGLEPLRPGVPRLPAISMAPIDAPGRGDVGRGAAERWLLGRPRPSADPGGEEPLPARELEVARLIAAGASKEEVAERLGMSPSSAATHLRRVYRKLGVNSRTALRARLEQMGAPGIPDLPRTFLRAPSSPVEESREEAGASPWIDLQAPAVAAALTSVDALATWEHLRRLDRPASAAAIAKAFEWEPSRVERAIDRLSDAGKTLVAQVPARGRGGAPQWRTTRDSLVVGHRLGDRHDEAIVATLERIYGPDRRKAIRSHAKSFEDRSPDEEIYLGIQVGAFTAEELERIWEILGEFEAIFESSHQAGGDGDDDSPWCDYHLTIDLEPLAPGILPQATMNCVGQGWATDLAKRLDERLAALSNRERSVAFLLREGLDRPQIAERLGLSLNTVATLSKRLYAKLGVRSRAELAKRLGMRGDRG